MSEEKKAAQAAEEKQTVQAEETANVPETEAAEGTAPASARPSSFRS